MGDHKKGFTHFANGDIGVAKITPCFQNRKSVILRNLENILNGLCRSSQQKRLGELLVLLVTQLIDPRILGRALLLERRRIQTL